jgi:thioredoxin-related protein
MYKTTHIMKNWIAVIISLAMSGSILAQVKPTGASSLTPGGQTNKPGRTEQQGTARTNTTRPSNTNPPGTRTAREVSGQNAPVQAPRLPRYEQQMQNSAVGSKTAAKTGAGARRPLNKKQEIVRINWMTMEQAIEKSKTEKRKIIIDVFTDWCGWCKHMDSTTFTAPAVASYINERYYPVKFNAEQQQDIVFKEKTYHFKKTGNSGCHELVLEWTGNKLKYPTVIFLDENLSLIQPLPGYQEAPKMEAIIRYFGDDHHKKTPWESFERNYVPTMVGGAQE